VAYSQDNARAEGKKSGIAALCQSGQRALLASGGRRPCFAHLEIMELHLSVIGFGKAACGEEELMKVFFLPLALLLISGAGAAFVKISIPAGTVIPVALHGSLSTKKSQAGQVVKARVMQDMPLGEGSKVRAGAYVQGKVISVTPAVNGRGASITFEFTQLVTSRGAAPITTNLRALASIVEVNSARIPQYDDRGSSSYVNTTWQIGGETVYRGGGHVMDGKTIVGEPVEEEGVLGRVRASSDGTCRGAVEGENRVQALWLFSSDACGVYGYRRVKIEQAGRTSPLGEITLKAERGDINIRGGSGMLLRVNNPSAANGS
jgi:hypothetical protein